MRSSFFSKKDPTYLKYLHFNNLKPVLEFKELLGKFSENLIQIYSFFVAYSPNAKEGQETFIMQTMMDDICDDISFVMNDIRFEARTKLVDKIWDFYHRLLKFHEITAPYQYLRYSNLDDEFKKIANIMFEIYKNGLWIFPIKNIRQLGELECGAKAALEDTKKQGNAIQVLLDPRPNLWGTP